MEKTVKVLQDPSKINFGEYIIKEDKLYSRFLQGNNILTFDFEIKSSALGKLLKFKAKIIYYY